MLEHKNNIKIGFISKTRGLDGEVQVVLQHKNLNHLDLEVVFLELFEKLVPFFVNDFQIINQEIGYFSFEDIDTVEKAKELVKAGVFINKELLKNEDNEHYSMENLAGMKVIDRTFGVLGVIEEVKELPKQYIAVLTYQSKELMFPLNEDLIDGIDWNTSTLQVNLPDGLLDVYLD